MPQYNYINFLKGIAILGVILVHSPQKIDAISPIILNGVHFGAFGCQLFFLISGFLAVQSWKRLDGSCTNTNVIFRFYKKRFLSIGPIYILFVVLYQGVAYLLNKLGYSSFMPICTESISVIVNIFLLQGLDFRNFNSVVPGGWFIGTITLFYIIFPLLYKVHCYFVRLNKHYGSYLLTVGALLFSFIVQLIIMLVTGSWTLSKSGSYLYYSILNQLPCLTIGIALHNVNLATHRTTIKNNFIFFIIIFIFTNVLYYVLRLNYWIYCFIPFLLAISFVFLFCFVRELYHFYRPSVVCRYIEKAGVVSYSAYFTNPIGTWIFPWIVQLLMVSIGCHINPQLLYFFLIIPIYLVTFSLVRPIDYIIKFFKSLI